ncbi:hypothetical protein QBC37DRAFT_378471 [Rhypophila decipiens]|uniref:Uncharacterized protein n=1 Tax=Rhypophila decipiens TaxID=261697 RepID=A0AAN6Y2N7_9PEZI|nr:hypothetical protein QBC37DRAFT_378471 [Rhypophila decipiens]
MLRYTVSILDLAALVAARNCRRGEIYYGGRLGDIAVHDNYDAQIREAMAVDGYSDPTWDQINNALFYCDDAAGNLIMIIMCSWGYNYDAQILEAMALEGYSDPTWDQINNGPYYRLSA